MIKTCELKACGKKFRPQGLREYDRKRTRFCSAECGQASRMAAYRKRVNPNPRPVGRPKKKGTATRRKK